MLLDEPLNGRGVGDDQLDVLADDVRQLIDGGRVQRFREGHLNGRTGYLHRDALIHARGGSGNGLQNLRCQLPVGQVHHLGAQLPGDQFELGVHVHHLEIDQDLAAVFAAAGLLLHDFLELEVVDEVLLFDERQQGMENRVGHER